MRSDIGFSPINEDNNNYFINTVCDKQTSANNLYKPNATTLTSFLRNINVCLTMHELTASNSHVGRGGSLVDSTLSSEGSWVRSNPALAATQVLHPQLPEALRRETLTQYPCRVGSASEK